MRNSDCGLRNEGQSEGLSFMQLGYRIVRPGDVGIQPLLLAQISLWRAAAWGVAVGEQAVGEAIEISAACKMRGIRTVFHPLEYPLTGAQAKHTLGVMRRLAVASDLGIIIHDEGGANGRRMSEAEETQFEENLSALSRYCPISIENAFNSGDATWFWERFVVHAPKSVSITIDIGHLESADVDSISFMDTLPERLAERVSFVHMHHKAEERYGIKDHWPLVPGCREIAALRALNKRKKGLQVILELDATDEGMGQSIELLKDLR
jgi:sugar phosphate isomerase/epimerase